MQRFALAAAAAISVVLITVGCAAASPLGCEGAILKAAGKLAEKTQVAVGTF